MHDTDQLYALLQEHFRLRRPRLNFIASFILALVKATTVNLALVATVFPSKASPESAYRRIQRFLALVQLDALALTRLLVRLLPEHGPLVLILDRTDWYFGKTPINLLMISCAFHGVALPIAWILLPKKGSSSTQERIALIECVLSVIPLSRWKALLADREFIGEAFFAYLEKRKIPFCIRIKNNASLGLLERSLKHRLSQLSVGEAKVLRGRRVVYGVPVKVALLRLEHDSVVLVTNRSARTALALYRERWQIETMFRSMKTHGFEFERTHLKAEERLWTLTALMAMAFSWAYRIGVYVDAHLKPIRIKKHGRKLYSYFTHGLRFLKRALESKNQDLALCFQVLSCT